VESVFLSVWATGFAGRGHLLSRDGDRCGSGFQKITWSWTAALAPVAWFYGSAIWFFQHFGSRQLPPILL